MITLFHGSHVSVPHPQVNRGRQKVDFGQGFYLTKLYNQAASWAKTIAERKGRNAQPIVSSFAFDYDGAKRGGFAIKKFELYDLEWLEYVVDCRRGGSMQHKYDLVEGGVANDNVIDTVEDYENGRITAKQALGQLKYKDVNHQICILNQHIADKYLTFVASEIIEDK